MFWSRTGGTSPEMTLVNRVSLFFLAALALCLIGYSLFSYWLIRNHLYDHVDDQLRSSLNALVAAVEVEEDAVKWQPLEHTITLGDDKTADEVRWIIIDEKKSLIDSSANVDFYQDRDAELLRRVTADGEEGAASIESPSWRLLRMSLAASRPKPASEMEPDEAVAVTIIVGHPTEQLRADLWYLAWLVVVLPLALWVIAAMVGRAYCLRALSPLRRMSSEARSISQADFRFRLPVASQTDELGELSRSFNRLLEQLQQAFDQQQRFTGDAAHQLRTPLTVLRGEIDLALRRPRTDEEYRRVLQTLRCQTEELQQIIETLLILARPGQEAGSGPDAEHIALADWLPHHLRRWHERCDRVRLVEETAQPLCVLAAPGMLGQAIDNLIENALKYSPPESPVVVRTARANGQASIAVEDEGPGLRADEREAVFEPFYRSSDARKSGVPGTGLGLTLAARIAHTLGGCITSENRTPRGSRFTLSLPAIEE